MAGQFYDRMDHQKESGKRGDKKYLTTKHLYRAKQNIEG